MESTLKSMRFVKDYEKGLRRSDEVKGVNILPSQIQINDSRETNIATQIRREGMMQIGHFHSWNTRGLQQSCRGFPSLRTSNWSRRNIQHFYKVKSSYVELAVTWCGFFPTDRRMAIAFRQRAFELDQRQKGGKGKKFENRTRLIKVGWVKKCECWLDWGAKKMGNKAMKDLLTIHFCFDVPRLKRENLN